MRLCHHPGAVPLGILVLSMVLAVAAPARVGWASDGGGGGSAAANDAVAVVIGNRDYRPGIPDVPYAGNDARAADAFLRYVLGYQAANVIALENASQAEMTAMFGNAADHRGKLWSWIKPGRSDVFVFYSGHGVPGLRDRRGYLLPVDADPDTPELNGYPVDLLISNLVKLEARSTLVLLDACFTGDSPGGRLIDDASPVYVRAEPPVTDERVVLISAARSGQLASWDHDVRLGLFTHHVLTALGGVADTALGGDGNGQISLAEVASYLDDTLTPAARRQFRRVQRAETVGPSGAVLVGQTPLSPWSPPPGVEHPTAALSPPVTDKGAPVSGGSGAPTHGRFLPPGKDPAAVEAFVDRHGAAVRSTIMAYDGAIGIMPGHAPITDLAWLHVVRAAGGDFDLFVQFRATGSSLVSYATVRIGVTDDTMEVLEVWR